MGGQRAGNLSVDPFVGSGRMEETHCRYCCQLHITVL